MSAARPATDATPAVPPEALVALRIAQSRLGDSLVAVYLHGSAVAGGLRPQSDVDVLAIVNRETSDTERRAILGDLLHASGLYPHIAGASRPIELTVFALAEFAAGHPIRSELQYGEWLRAGFETGKTPEREANPDHALLLAQARQQAISLFGPAATELLPLIPSTDIRRAMADCLGPLLAELHGDERNVLLTLARMWHTLATGAFVPKDWAAAWAAPELPVETAEVLTVARNAYLGAALDDWRGREDEAARAAGELRQRIVALLQLPAAT